MEAKTKYHKHLINELQPKLKPLSKAKQKWAIDKSFDFYGVSHYSSIICLECTHSWKGKFENDHATCPKCKKKLRSVGKWRGYEYVTNHVVFFDRVGDIAVIRVFYVRKDLQKGQKAKISFSEVIQKWFDPNAVKHTHVSKTMLAMMGYSRGGWSKGSELEIRANHDLVNTYRGRPTSIGSYCDIYPYMKIPKRFKQAGFTLKYSEMEMRLDYDQLMYILMDSRMETLYKYGESEMVHYFLRYKLTPKLWTALKINFRNHYLVNNPDISWNEYVDYLKWLIQFKADVHNPHFVCPDDFRVMHSLYYGKKRRHDAMLERRAKERDAERRKEEIKRKAERAVLEAKEYAKRIGKYLPLVFKSGKLEITVIDSPEQLMKEADELVHCAFSSNYHKKVDSLLMSARVDGRLVETVEIDLRTMKVSQSRGYDNHATKYNERIVNLVKKNMHKVKAIRDGEMAEVRSIIEQQKAA